MLAALRVMTPAAHRPGDGPIVEPRPLPQAEEFARNRELQRLAMIISQRIAGAADANAIDWLITDELFEHEEHAAFIAHGGSYWTAERALGLGAFAEYVLTVYLGARMAAATDTGAEVSGQSTPVDLHDVIYGDSVPGPAQNAIYEGLAAQLAVLTLLVRGGDAAAMRSPVYAALTERAASGNKAFLAYLLATAAEQEVEVPRQMADFLRLQGVSAVDLKLIEREYAEERRAIQHYLHRVAHR